MYYVGTRTIGTLQCISWVCATSKSLHTAHALGGWCSPSRRCVSHMNEWASDCMPECESQMCQTRPSARGATSCSFHLGARPPCMLPDAPLLLPEARPPPLLDAHLINPPHTTPAPPPNPPTARQVPFTWGACLDKTHSAVAHAVAPSFVSSLAKLIVAQLVLAQLVLACVDVIVVRVSNDGEVGSRAGRGAPPRRLMHDCRALPRRPCRRHMLRLLLLLAHHVMLPCAALGTVCA